MRTTKQWGKLPNEPVESPSLETFNTQLHKAQSYQLQSHKRLYFEQEVGLRSSKVCSHQRDTLVLC